MDIFLRVIAIFVEVLILATIMFSILWGVRLIFFDLLPVPKYKNMVTAALTLVGIIALVFFISHLTTFYPAVVR